MTLKIAPAGSNRFIGRTMVALVCFAAWHTAAAQNSGPMPAPTLRQPQAPAQGRGPIRVNVEVVNTPVVVHDSKGQLVLDLEQG